MFYPRGTLSCFIFYPLTEHWHSQCERWTCLTTIGRFYQRFLCLNLAQHPILQHLSVGRWRPPAFGSLLFWDYTDLLRTNSYTEKSRSKLSHVDWKILCLERGLRSIKNFENYLNLSEYKFNISNLCRTFRLSGGTGKCLQDPIFVGRLEILQLSKARKLWVIFQNYASKLMEIWRRWKVLRKIYIFWVVLNFRDGRSWKK